jgi:hypothetical protein
VLGKWLIEWIEQGVKKRAKCHVASSEGGVKRNGGILRDGELQEREAA